MILPIRKMHFLLIYAIQVHSAPARREFRASALISGSTMPRAARVISAAGLGRADGLNTAAIMPTRGICKIRFRHDDLFICGSIILRANAAEDMISGAGIMPMREASAFGARIDEFSDAHIISKENGQLRHARR